jgi:hypothetical protein
MVAGFGGTAAGILILLGALCPVAKGVTPERMPAPPASPLEHHDPDATTCNSDRILAAWSQQLQAYADQPPAVLERLQAVQRDLATLSLNRCIQRGFLSRDAARALAVQMGLEPASRPEGRSGQVVPAQSSGQRP